MSILLALFAALLVILFGAAVYAVVIYNGLVALKNSLEKSWSNIDVLLKQRFDELPKLVQVCKGYMEHEHRTLEAVVKARASLEQAGTEGEALHAQSAITQSLRSLFAVVENYPNLKADASFRQLQSRISELEDQIADRREFFNESVNLYNIRIEQFPDNLVANAFSYTPRRLWEIDPAHRADVSIEFQK